VKGSGGWKFWDNALIAATSHSTSMALGRFVRCLRSNPTVSGGERRYRVLLSFVVNFGGIRAQEHKMEVARPDHLLSQVAIAPETNDHDKKSTAEEIQRHYPGAI
jgi:hypothetical protein